MIEIVVAVALAQGLHNPSEKEIAAWQAKVNAAYAAARAVAKTSGCSDVKECKSVELGARACGGPQTWVVYCSRTTDEKKLVEKAGQATKLEAEMNSKLMLGSGCSVSVKPPPRFSDGECR